MSQQQQGITNKEAYTESNASYQKVLNQLAALCEKNLTSDGEVDTAIPFITLYKSSKETPLLPGILTPSICLILQGEKNIHINQNIIQYNSGDYVASLIDFPVSAQVIGASEDKPYIGLRVEFTAQEIFSVMMDAKINVNSKDNNLNMAAFIGKSNFELLDLLMRLLRLLDKPDSIPFLSTLIKREIIYHLLTGDYGQLFLQQAFIDSNIDSIGRAITLIKENISEPFTVEGLAKLCNMSVSGLHHKFKATLNMGPLQYQKNLRLQEARRLLVSGSMSVGDVAIKVGYESYSQFNREYRRLFGLPPLQDIKEVRINTKMNFM
ncbi:HTH-type transcriptional activator RhaS [Clostridium chromiireducens]|uniref:HTH-type transcriptional activator RhaS n=2 Tax=Clostridium chromiireducens TaxID=225345 RepID=A0A1V4INH7_9CLOT|nr:HTH-type transcriptional activator RhaS [Clostridium chromiireducens]